MRPALSGLLDGLLSRGGLLTLTRVWTLTLIFPATWRQKSPFLLIVLESKLPQLRPAPPFLLLLPAPRLKSEPFCFPFFFFYLGSEPRMYVMSFWALKLNEYPNLLLFFLNCVPYAALLELTWIGGYMELPEHMSFWKLSY